MHAQRRRGIAVPAKPRCRRALCQNARPHNRQSEPLPAVAAAHQSYMCAPAGSTKPVLSGSRPALLYLQKYVKQLSDSSNICCCTANNGERLRCCPRMAAARMTWPPATVWQQSKPPMPGANTTRFLGIRFHRTRLHGKRTRQTPIGTHPVDGRRNRLRMIMAMTRF